ncbi:pleckstrin homology domain-containing family O member 1-like isoform X1 [Periophthalmus magnuspinnatus]|uniref:pleckstrin homology domain-containing family O member 1-like isoform X1 n=1 Tax=Periophthalmus magnuspinnatus TaxID=409849 RepID=UPI00145A25E6|nr:pleckstrin homology domain-containing family O member 1-like isoform X1 [Periophthalmus magnuspinnatus]
MKKNSSGKRGGLDPDKTGWIRKFCGKGLFREVWKNRFVILRQDQLFICRKEVKEPGRADEVLDLLDFDHCEEIRKNRSRSKKNHSKFRLLRSSAPGNTVATLVFLAVSPEEKDSWIQVLNVALTRAKNRVLDEVTVEDAQLAHLTRDRVRIPHTRRLPTRGHLLAVASASSDGALTLDLIHEEDPGHRSQTDRKPHTLPRQVAQGGKSVSSEKSLSLDQIPRDPSPGPKSKYESKFGSISRLQDLIQEKIHRTEQLLTELRPDLGRNQDQGLNQDQSLIQDQGLTQNQEPNQDLPQDQEEARRLLTEARDQWNQAHEVLSQVQELKDLYQRMDPSANGNAKPSSDPS